MIHNDLYSLSIDTTLGEIAFIPLHATAYEKMRLKAYCSVSKLPAIALTYDALNKPGITCSVTPAWQPIMPA